MTQHDDLPPFDPWRDPDPPWKEKVKAYVFWRAQQHRAESRLAPEDVEGAAARLVRSIQAERTRGRHYADPMRVLKTRADEHLQAAAPRERSVPVDDVAAIIDLSAVRSARRERDEKALAARRCLEGLGEHLGKAMAARQAAFWKAEADVDAAQKQGRSAAELDALVRSLERASVSLRGAQWLLEREQPLEGLTAPQRKKAAYHGKLLLLAICQEVAACNGHELCQAVLGRSAPEGGEA